MKDEFRTVLFDLDGTLTDPKVGITTAIRYAMNKLERPLSPQKNLDWCIGPPLQDNFAILLETDDPLLIDKSIAAFREYFAEKGLFENELYAEVPAMLAVMHQTDMVYMIWLAMLGSGPPRPGPRARPGIPLWGRPMVQPTGGVLCVAAPGTTFRGSRAALTATGIDPMTSTSTWGFGWCCPWRILNPESWILEGKWAREGVRSWHGVGNWIRFCLRQIVKRGYII